MRPARRIRLLALGGGLGLCALVARLATLQLAEHEQWEAARERNILGYEWLPARRGRILDRTGLVLAEDRSEFTLEIVYRDFRRGHPRALLRHTDQCLRAFARSGADLPAGLVAGEPLAYGDPPARFRAALDGLLALPMRLLHAAGPLEPDLRGVLRYYAFEILRRGFRGRLRKRRVLRLQFDRTLEDPSDKDLASFLTVLGAEPDAVARMQGFLARGSAELERLAASLGDGLVLPGPSGSGRGGLQDYLEALDRHTQARARARIAKRRATGVGRRGLLARIRRWLMPRSEAASTMPVAPQLAQAELMAEVFRLERTRRRMLCGLRFETSVALVLGHKERLPGFVLGEQRRRVWPRRAPSGMAYRFLGLVSDAVYEPDAVRASVPHADEDDGLDADPRARLTVEDSAWEADKRRRLDAAARDAQELGRRGYRGVEARLDPILTGELGLREVRRDRLGRERSARQDDPRRGWDLRLTVDAELQDLALTALEACQEGPQAGRSAALVVVDASSGDVDCLAWMPATLERKGRGAPLPDLLNRAARLADPPYLGSVVKPFLAYEGLVTGKVAPGTFARCGPEDFGWRPEGGPTVHCSCRLSWLDKDPAVELEAGLVYSCNAYFAQVGARLGFDGIRAGLARFGLWAEGADFTSPLALRIDAPGPVLASKRPRRLEFRALVKRAIGYGQQAVPLLVARAYATLGTGKLRPLRFLAAAGDEELPVDPGIDLGLDAEAIERIRAALARVPLEGTARDAGLGRFQLAGKTGTAEYGKVNNAWFAGWWPAKGARYAFCATFYRVPEGVHGGDIAAECSRRFLSAIAARPELAARYALAGGR